ncbi:protein mono-ADP-ribosyltransferase PARP4 isoform X1 [Xyrichtys novacula]|uniref:Poly [ADP-ribose] polymerase n=1 Tax=Xyrichtys novacula TaxID=13765 RepID=A0AAV1H455_XYRNO|nr:protein mono-ADP-ribosyltransferase PARP4 isoform X1 [Xyrichtys novacula]
MAVFENCSVVLDLKNVPFKKQKKLKSAVTENGGKIVFVINDKCSLVVTNDVSSLSTNRRHSIQKCQTPIVGVDYIFKCVEKGVLLPVDEYKLDSSPSSASSPPVLPSSPKKIPLIQESKVPISKEVAEPCKNPAKPVVPVRVSEKKEAPEEGGRGPGKFRHYTETDPDLPTFPDNFQVAKYSIFEKVNSNTWSVLELQSAKGKEGRQYRVVRYCKEDITSKAAAVRDVMVFPSTSAEALEVYKELRKNPSKSGIRLRDSFPTHVQALGSDPLQQLLLEEKLNTGSLSKEVGVFVELLWTEALGCLDNILRVPINKLSLNDVSRVQGFLLQTQKKLKEGNYADVASLMEEVYTLLPHKAPPEPLTAKLISQKLDLCQLIRDMLNVSEMTLRSPVPSCVGKYRALRCSIEAIPPGSSEFQAVVAPLQLRDMQVQQVLRVNRGAELQTFKSEIGNIKSLLHSTSPSNFVGVLSRGLLLPHAVVEHHGIELTDAGNLGSGIYFGDSMRTSLKYSKPSMTEGSRLLLVCDVALGKCKDLYKRDLTLTEAPEGYNSVRGVCRSRGNRSDFMDDEYVVYSPDQVKLKYVVKFSLKDDKLKEFSPDVNISAEPCPPSTKQELSAGEDGIETGIENPLKKVTAGLLDSSGQQLPLQAVHVKCKLMDLLSQVVIFQKYTNQSSVPIEAKYVFPLDDSAAVCGFEAFINGKHIIGQVKEKEKARKEYKEAIKKGHGAYLMDQDAPDVFTISVGNLPPGATVLIKVTFVSELTVQYNSIGFRLPGSVAPWQESAALNQTTQVTVEKVCVTDEDASTREFTLEMSIEMPYEISHLACLTHKVQTKKTDCKAVVRVLPGEIVGSGGFTMLISLSKTHLPRMWVENHPDKDSQACMLVFYPEFKADSSSVDEVVLLIDTSESMKGESLHMAQKIALQFIKQLHSNLRLNVILFGTDHREAFLTARPFREAFQEAKSFIKSFTPVGGSTELWRPLRALSLLPPSSGVRNLLLLSDGHIQNTELTLKLLRENAQHTRLFTCGLSPTANRYMLRALAQAGGGAYEFFDTKAKHNWSKQVISQTNCMQSPGCSSVSVKWQQFNPKAPPPLQAPKQLNALFNNCHTLVFGFVPHCTQATLLGNLSGQGLKTMVSTTELQKTKGTFLHKLTARAIIRDYEDGCLDSNETDHEGKKAELKEYVVELSKEFSILSQFTSFVAIEERDSDITEEGFTDIPKLLAEEDVDFLPYIGWESYGVTEKKKAAKLHRDDGSYDSESDDVSDRALNLSDKDEEMDDEECCEDSESTESESSSPESDFGLEISNAIQMSMRRARGGADQEVKRLLGGPSRHRASYSPAPLIRPCGLLPPPCPPPPAISFSAISFRAPRPQGGLFGGPPPPPPPPQGGLFGAPPPPPPQGRLSGGPRLTTSGLQRSLCSGPLRTDSGLQAGLFGGPPPPPPSSTGVQVGGIHYHAMSSLLSRQNAMGDKMGTFRRASLDPVLASAPPPVSEPQGIREVDSKQRMESCSVPDFQLRSFEGSDTEISVARFDKSMRSSFKDQQPQQGFGYQAHAVPDKFQTLGEEHQMEDTPFPLKKRSRDTWSAKGLEDKSEPTPDEDQPRATVLKRLQKTIEVPIVDLCEGPPPIKEGSSLRRFPEAVIPHSEDQPQVTLQRSRQRTIEDCCESKEGGSSLRRFQRAVIPHSEDPPQVTLQRSSQRTMQMTDVWRPFMGKSADSEEKTLRWTKIFKLQHPEGYWEITGELGKLINVHVDLFANEFLKNKGINSLGEKARADILRLVATLLVLQLMRVEKLEEGKLLCTLFRLDNPSQSRPERWEEVKKAVDWVRWADRQYPCVYSRLEFGLSWESSTLQLLGYQALPPFSPLKGLTLQWTSVSLLVR